MKKIFTLMLISCYAVVFGEFFIRWMDPQPLFPRYVQGSPDGIRMNIPNAVYRQRSPEVDVEIRINNQGIRANREIPLAKPADTCRIITLGDSFMMGYEVALENSFSALVEQRLADEGIKAETVNLAVSGFGTAEHLIALQSRGAPFNPDLVIMEWHSTDPKDNRRSKLFKLDDGKLVADHSSYLPAIKTREQLMKIPGYSWLIGNSHLYSAVRERVAILVKGILFELTKKKAEPNGSNEPIDKEPENLADLFPDLLDEQLILELDRFTRSLGAKLLVIGVPVEWEGDYKVRSSLEYLNLEMLDNINIVTPFPQFRADADHGISYYYKKGQGHWNIAGNQVSASIAANEIISNEWCNQAINYKAH